MPILETLIIATCLTPTGDSCKRLGEYYYKEKKIDVMIKRTRRQYPVTDEIMSKFLLVAGIMQTRKATIPIYSQKSQTMFMTIEEHRVMVTHRLDF